MDLTITFVLEMQSLLKASFATFLFGKDLFVLPFSVAFEGELIV